MNHLRTRERACVVFLRYAYGNQIAALHVYKELLFFRAMVLSNCMFKNFSISFLFMIYDGLLSELHFLNCGFQCRTELILFLTVYG